MPVDHIRYDILAQDALRGVVRTVLADAAKNGLPGEHHFKITFSTVAPGARVSERLRAQYPESMTIILQHQFWDLDVGDESFSVGLSFAGVPEQLTVPFEAISAFFDPAVQFGFQFESIEAEASAAGGSAAAKAAGKMPGKTADKTPDKTPDKTADRPPASLPAAAANKPDALPDDGEAGGQVVRLDRFRKK